MSKYKKSVDAHSRMAMSYSEALTRNPDDQALFDLIHRYGDDTEMTSDYNVLAMSRKALEDNEAFLASVDEPVKHNPCVGELLMVTGGWLAGMAFVAAVFVLAGI